jgi:hypothetical protein
LHQPLGEQFVEWQMIAADAEAGISLVLDVGDGHKPWGAVRATAD